ncbi:MAG: hypothetical protein ABJC12_12625 [Saprospiraceae bacterium]
MKNSILLPIFICILFIIGMSACERTELQKSVGITDEQIQTRTEDCDACGVGCCCCGIELAGVSATATLDFCGLCEGDYLCGTYSPPSPCSSTISGFGKTIVLSSLTPRKIFCVPEGGSFRIYNGTATSVDVSFTCQHDITRPDTHVITIPAHSEVFFVSDGDCFLQGC